MSVLDNAIPKLNVCEQKNRTVSQAILSSIPEPARLFIRNVLFWKLLWDYENEHLNMKLMMIQLNEYKQ